MSFSIDRSPTFPRGARPWRPRRTALYMYRNGGNTVRRLAPHAGFAGQFPCGGARIAEQVKPKLWDSGVRRNDPPRLPGDTSGPKGRSNGEDMVDALIKSLNPRKAPDARPAELDPAEFLAAAVRADQPRPSRAEAEHAVHTLLAYIGENPHREGLLDTPRRVVEA